MENNALTLESLIDSQGLPRVLETLAQVCREKAEHIRENWQDTVTARGWDKMATVLDRASDKAQANVGGV